MTGVIVLIVALAATGAVGAAVRLRAGKVRPLTRTDDGDSPAPPPSAARPVKWRILPSGAHRGVAPRETAEVLTAGELGASLGERATLVQFSTEFCAYCGPSRVLLREIASGHPGVAVVEIDAAERMDLTRRFRVFATPTILVLGPDGAVAARSSGKPQKAGLAESVRSVLDDGVRS